MTCKLDDSDRQSVTFDLHRPDCRSTKITLRPRFVTSTAWKWSKKSSLVDNIVIGFGERGR